MDAVCRGFHVLNFGIIRPHVYAGLPDETPKKTIEERMAETPPRTDHEAANDEALWS